MRVGNESIHADDTLVIDEKYDGLKQKVICTYDFFGERDQTVNIGKSKFMCLDSNSTKTYENMIINGQVVKYTQKEKYLGHYITDDNSLNESITCDLQERESNVIVKYRNFINNNKGASIHVRLKVFQACFCSTILSNCEVWGHCLPKRVLTLYNKGLKLALDVRLSTPTALIFLESRQPSVLALVRKRHIQFWKTLQKEEGTELSKLISRAEKTLYIKHYINYIKKCFKSPDNAFETLNGNFYDELLKTVINCKDEQTKFQLYKNIYNIRDNIPSDSITLTIENENRRKLLTKYIVSSHNLVSETSKWLENGKCCKKCTTREEETLNHFIFDCSAYRNIRSRFSDFPADLTSFFVWKHKAEVIELLHNQRGN